MNMSFNWYVFKVRFRCDWPISIFKLISDIPVQFFYFLFFLKEGRLAVEKPYVAWVLRDFFL